LLPALGRAKAKALQTQCLDNQKQIGLAYSMYAADSQESYPRHPDWASVSGQNGAFYVFVAATNRPLNPYVRHQLQTFSCPADKGDSDTGATNCFGVYGNSYLVAWADYEYPDYKDPADNTKRYCFRTRSVTSSAADPGDTPMKTTVAGNLTTKIIQGDWVWHANRANTDPKSIWHNYRGQSLSVMFYADGHATACHFPSAMTNWLEGPPPDPDFLWW